MTARVKSAGELAYRSQKKEKRVQSETQGLPLTSAKFHITGDSVAAKSFDKAAGRRWSPGVGQGGLHKFRRCH